MMPEQTHPLTPGGYALHSELARLCLPSAYQDASRRLAWVNSLCLFFLVVGLIGLKAPELIIEPFEEPLDIVPVVFSPPQEEPKVEPVVQADETDQPPDPSIDTPQIATVVAADPTTAAFAVPVDGPVVFAPARFASAPPPTPPRPAAKPKPTLFVARGKTEGTYPDPPYPSLALRRHNEGKVLLYVIVDPSGVPASVEVRESSGYVLLDTGSLEWVKNKWRWPPSETRHYLVPIEYQIR